MSLEKPVDYESTPLTRSEYIAAIVHLYRGELYRANSWRIRLDNTTNWAILTAAGLGFLGLGAQPPLPEWGAMIASGRRFILDQWWVATMPGVAILTVSLGFNLLGDGLRDALDPRGGEN